MSHYDIDDDDDSDEEEEKKPKPSKTIDLTETLAKVKIENLPFNCDEV